MCLVSCQLSIEGKIPVLIDHHSSPLHTFILHIPHAVDYVYRSSHGDHLPLATMALNMLTDTHVTHRAIDDHLGLWSRK